MYYSNCKSILFILLFILSSKPIFAQKNETAECSNLKDMYIVFKTCILAANNDYAFHQKYGGIVLTFTVTKKGYMKNFKMKRPFTPEFDKKVIDCIKSQKLPLWKPAYKNGKPIPSEITMPVRLEKFG